MRSHKKKSVRTSEKEDQTLDLRAKLNFLSEKIGTKIQIGKNSNYAFRFPHIITEDDCTPSYSSHFILIQKSQDEIWGFHVLHLTVDGKFGSASAALKVHLGKLDISTYGPRFLKTFERSLERTTKIEAVLGKTNELKNDPRWLPWRGRESVNDLLYSVYSQMWDMDVVIAEFTTIPKDIVDEYRIIFQMEFGD